jgi:DNA-3-methyladenine glycosylase
MKLKRSFYLRSPLEVARDLIGKELVHVTDKGKLSARIIEVEAYGGDKKDLASHSLNGKKTDRNKIIFGEGGFVYIYLIYGMYYCFNIVVGKKNYPATVFIRSVEPLEGLELMRLNRGLGDLSTSNIVKLTNGPGKLCQAMTFDKGCYGVDLCSNKIYITDADSISEGEIDYTPRINIDYAEGSKHYPWRIILKSNKFLSK